MFRPAPGSWARPDASDELIEQIGPEAAPVMLWLVIDHDDGSFAVPELVGDELQKRCVLLGG